MNVELLFEAYMADELEPGVVPTKRGGDRADLARLREAEFPVAKRYVYLNHASLGPLPRRTAAALSQLLEDFRDRGVLAETRWVPAIERARLLVARLLNVPPGSLAFMRNTSEGLGLIADGYPWQRGDVIITAQGEFPANVYPWLARAAQGVETRLVPLRDGRVDPADVEAALADTRGRARLVSLSWVQYHNGFRCDVAAIAAICRDHDVLFGLDAIQGAGVLPLDLQATPVDFCAFGCHKWMLSPQGSGILYLGDRMRERLGPAHTGWLGVAWRDYLRFDYDSPLMDSAARHEEGTRSLLGIAGLEQSLGLLLEVGAEAIAARLFALTERLAQGLLKQGLEVRTPLEPEARSGIISVRAPGASDEQRQRETTRLFEALKAERIVVALREGALRLSPHLYTTEAEIDLVLDVLETSLRQQG